MTATRPEPGPAEHERGQATVELVLVLPIVVLLVLAVVQVGVVARDRLLVVHAAREGARVAAVEPSIAAVRAAALDAGGLDPDRLDVSRAVTPGPSGAGPRVTVAVTYRSPTDVPLVGLLVPDVPLRSTLTVRQE